jgi:hypothetical protein
MTDRQQGIAWHPAEGQVAEVCMSIQTADVRLTKIHPYPVCAPSVPRVSEVVRHTDRIAFGILVVITRQGLLHFECPPRAICDDPLCPSFDRLTLLAPVFVNRIPCPTVLQLEWCQPYRAGASILSDLISPERCGSPDVHSLRNLTCTISPGTQTLRVRSVTVLRSLSAGNAPSVVRGQHRQDGQFHHILRLDYRTRRFVLCFDGSRSGGLRRDWCQPHPFAVCGNVSPAFRSRKKHDIRSADDVLAPILPTTLRRQSAPRIAVVVEIQHRDHLADDESITGNGDIILESLPKSPELLILAVSIDRDLLDEFI